MKFREIIKLVRQDGWQLIRTAGSHTQWKHPTRLGIVTIAGHPGKDVPPGTQRSILK